MSKDFGGIWISLAEFPAQRIDYFLNYGSGVLTLALPKSYLSQGASCLALVSGVSGDIEYLAVATASSTTTDLEIKVQLGPAKKFVTAIGISNLLDSLPPLLRRHLEKPIHRVRSVPPKTWDALIESAISRGSLLLHDIQELKATIDSRSERVRSSLPDVVVFERDAIATAFEIFGGGMTRKAFISSSAPAPDAPFIQRLKHRDLNVIEDSMISHDVLSFPGLVALRPALVGAVQLTTHSGTLTILNANRTKIERTLGVDLVYYNHHFNSFVLVQYKRLLGDKDPVYRPKHDPNLAKEIERMRAFEEGRREPETDYETFRLIESPFFLKLCKARTPGDWNGRMLQGMYFPLSLWDLLLKSPAAVGTNKGVAVSFDRSKRRFSNSEFTHLLSQGWLGTASTETERIEDIIVKQLDAGRSIVAAVHEPGRTNEFVRDGRGRFAQDDETAV